MTALSVLVTVRDPGQDVHGLHQALAAQGLREAEVVRVHDPAGADPDSLAASSEVTQEGAGDELQDQARSPGDRVSSERAADWIAAVNEAVRSSTGDVVVVLPPGEAAQGQDLSWLEAAWQSAPVGTAAIGPSVPHVDLGDPGSWIWCDPLGAGAAIRRDALVQLGGFDPQVPAAMYWALGIRILIAGYTIRSAQGKGPGSGTPTTTSSDQVRDYSVISEQHLHPYLAERGRFDLIARNVRGFLTHGEDVDRALLERILLNEPADRIVKVLAGLAAQPADPADGLKDCRELLRERTYELHAALDRLGAAEVDRRVAQDEVARWQNTLIYRAARKTRRTFGK